MSVATLELSPAAEALRQSPIAALRKVLVTESDRTVVIQGTVRSYYLKQLAQETVMPVLQGRSLLNRLSVVRN